MKKILLLSLVAYLCAVADLSAADRYWIASSTANWNSTANWSTSSGGASGASVPGSGDVARFDANGTGNCDIDANVNVSGMNVGSGYTGTISQGTYTITLGTTGGVFAGGTFTGGSATITATGAVTISGTAFTSTSGNFTTNSNFTLSSGSFTHNSGTFTSTATSTIAGTIDFYNLTFTPSANSAYAISNTITVANTLLLNGSANLNLNTGTIDVSGNITTTNSGTGSGSATININGTGTQTLTGNASPAQGSLPHVTINKSSGTLNLSDTITVRGNWTYTAGTISAGSSTVVFYNTKTISGSHSLNNVTFSGSANSIFTISSGNTLTVNGRTHIAGGSSYMDFEDGNLHMKGHIALTNTAILGVSGDAIMTINGTTKQILDGAGAFRGGEFTNLVINKSDTLVITDNITIRFDYTYTAGTIVATGSTVYFDGINKTISGTHALHNVFFYGANPTTYTIASGTTLTVKGTLSTSGTAVTLNTGTIHAEGDISWPLTSTTTGGGSATIVINGASTQTFTGGTTAFGSRLPKIQINKSGGTLNMTGFITSTSAWTHTNGTMNATGTSTVYFVNTQRIVGTHTLNHVSFSGAGAYTYTVKASDILTANGNVTFSGSSAITLDSGTVHAVKNVRTTNSSTGTGGNATIVLTGSTTDTLTGSGTAGAGKFPHLTINRSGGSVRMESIISVTGHWIYTQGTVTPASSSVALYGTFNLDGQGTSGTMSFNRLQVSTGTRTLTGNIDVNENFTIASGATCTAGVYDIAVGGNWNSQGTWTYGKGTVTFDGGGYHRIQTTGGATVSFGRVRVNHRSGSITLVNPMQIDTSLVFDMGRVKTTTTNYLHFIDNATCTVTNDDSAYVHGPVRKTGDDAFNFPLGDTTLHDSIAYHPLAITAPSSTGDRFEAQYYAVAQTVGDSLVDSLYEISGSEYWRLDRQMGSSSIIVTLNWNRNSNVQDYNTLRIANWNNVKWLDLGGTSINVTSAGTGSVTAISPPTYVSNSALLALGNAVSGQPYAVLHRKLDGGYYLVRNGALYFMYDEEYNDTDDELAFTIYDEQRRTVASGSGTYAILKTSDYGDNRFFINLFDCGTNANGSVGAGVFILEVTNEKSEKWMLRFKHVTTITPNCSGSGSGE